MWRRTAQVMALLMAHGLAPGSSGQELATAPSLPAQCPIVRFEIILGRLRAIHLNTGHTRATRGDETEETPRETMQVTCEGSTPLVRYERRSPGQRITVEFQNSFLVSLQRESPDQPADWLELKQPRQGDLRLTLGRDPARQQWTAPSLWHLFLAEPEVCEQELVPLLLLLRPTWDFSQHHERLETALFQASQGGEVVPRARLAHLVVQLAHRDFRQRQAADQELRAIGPSVLPYLTSLDARSLNSEQRQRIRTLCESMLHATPDTPERIAQWLVDDEQVWLTFLAHRDAKKRYLAMQRLQQIRPELTDFDPFGEESHRQVQLAELKGALNRY